MKKKILLISSMLLTFILIIFVSLNNTNNENKNVLSNIEKDKQVINSNMLTLMYETDAGTGIYEETKDTTWPESGYIFNENLSGCENGGELEYNSINNTVNLLSNKSDRCYVYFDKYDGVWIDNVSVTNVTGSSVTLNVGATSENGSITTYYYALDDNEEYQESTSNIITINDLNKLTEYKIKVYAVDSTNAKSNIYELSVSTTDDSKPVINNVNISNITPLGFTLTVDATSDIGIKRYFYIIESDNIAGTSTINNYTFNNLKENTTYEVKIFARDNKNIDSEEYEISTKTSSYVLPTLNSITINNVTENSITVTANATAGSANIDQYYFSINNGAYVNSTSNSYTFTKLNSSTTYNIKAYVTDIYNKNSSEKSINATTTAPLIEIDIFGEIYYAEEGMTWNNFINSSYNTNNAFSTYNGRVMYSHNSKEGVLVGGRTYQELEYISSNSRIYSNFIYIIS